jgi:hypothetical protein
MVMGHRVRYSSRQGPLFNAVFYAFLAAVVAALAATTGLSAFRSFVETEGWARYLISGFFALALGRRSLRCAANRPLGVALYPG